MTEHTKPEEIPLYTWNISTRQHAELCEHLGHEREADSAPLGLDPELLIDLVAGMREELDELRAKVRGPYIAALEAEPEVNVMVQKQFIHIVNCGKDATP